jgi:glyoxylase-like metal-dependent hydrolase (beta-lactamase superfamily II)
MLKTIATAGLIFTASINGFAEDKPKLSFSSTEVAPGIFMLMGVGGFTGGNIGLSVGADGVVMIDDSMPPMLDIMKTAISTVTDQPVDYLINTHVHGDHTGNNATMGEDGAIIVAHKNLRINMLTKGVNTPDGKKPAPKSALPVITFSKEISFHLNGEDAEVFHVDNAHTDGDAVIFFKSANVIHSGDAFFNGMFPFIDLDNGGSVDGYIAAQKKIISLSNDNTKIIPGHGPLSNKKELQQAVAMLIDSRALIAALKAKGQTEDQVVKTNPLAKYHDHWNWQFITTEKMTRQVYKSL